VPSVIRRVLLIPSWYPSEDRPVGGIFVEDQAKVLSERFDVLVFTQRIYGWRDVLQGRIPTDVGFAYREGVRMYVQRVFLPPSLPIRASTAYQFARASAAMAAITRNWGKPDIVHPHVVLPCGWIGARLGRALGVPVVMTEHTGPFSAHLTSASHRTLVAETLKSCATVIAVSPSLASQIGQVAPLLPVEVIGNVIPTRFFQLAESATAAGSPGAPLRLLSVSLLTREKGYEYLLRSARLLIDGGFRKFELHIGGDGPDKPRLETMIRELRLEKTCHLLGALKRTEVRDWMQRCDVFVLPSLAETFGVVIGEAMACGKPVLATHCGGADFQVTPATGVLVAPGDSSALAAGIRVLDAKRSEFTPETIRDTVARRFGESAFLESITRRYQEAASGVASPGHETNCNTSASRGANEA
jgi:L-malate glycosyltransferase